MNKYKLINNEIEEIIHEVMSLKNELKRKIIELLIAHLKYDNRVLYKTKTDYKNGANKLDYFVVRTGDPLLCTKEFCESFKCSENARLTPAMLKKHLADLRVGIMYSTQEKISVEFVCYDDFMKQSEK